ncbi:MAG: ABC transporter substrate-binding protein [Acidimicrobiales bacterium]
MRSPRRHLFVAAAVGLALVAAGCGSDDETTTESPTPPKGTVNIGAFNFSESNILAGIYEGALSNAGFTVSVRPNLGSREIVAPALERGEIDLYPGYAATDLEFYNNGAGQATPDAQATTEKLRAALAPKGATALEPAPAIDANAFAVTKETADKYNLKKLSDLAPIGGELLLGGPPECPTRPFCQLGLVNTYGITFKDFKPLDVGGPLTVAALKNGDIQVGLLTSTDGNIPANGFVVLEDDKGLQNADNVVPVIRTAVASEEARQVLNKVSAELTTADLTELNRRADVDKEDTEVLAQDWLDQHGF